MTLTIGQKVLKALTLLALFEHATEEEPMIAMVNERTMMINGDGKVYLLVFSREHGAEGFIQIRYVNDRIKIINRDKLILKKNVKTFKEYKKLDRRIGMKMNAI